MKYSIICLMIFINIYLWGSPPSFPLNPLEPNIVSYNVLFQFNAPLAKKVNLAGSFPDNQWLNNGYDTDVMYDDGTNGDKIAGDGIWSIVKALKNGKYEYKFVVDCKSWYNDPNACSSDFGRNNSIDNRNNSIIIVKSMRDNLVGIGHTPKFQIYDFQAQPILKTHIKYPDDAKSSDIEGVVILQIEIFEDGTIGAIEVLKSLLSGPGGLDEAAVKAVRQWEFTPATSEGKPVSSWHVLEITFPLDKEN